MPTASVAVIGGTGFYSFLDQVERVEEIAVETPYGEPSAPYTCPNPRPPSEGR